MVKVTPRPLGLTEAGLWRGSLKNDHISHLLLSFPAHVKPEKAKLIAEVWAFEMFQARAYQDEIWSYVVALHTDRPHPHVHIVVNNRDTARGPGA